MRQLIIDLIVITIITSLQHKKYKNRKKNKISKFYINPITCIWFTKHTMLHVTLILLNSFYKDLVCL